MDGELLMGTRNPRRWTSIRVILAAPAASGVSPSMLMWRRGAVGSASALRLIWRWENQWLFKILASAPTILLAKASSISPILTKQLQPSKASKATIAVIVRPHGRSRRVILLLEPC